MSYNELDGHLAKVEDEGRIMTNIKKILKCLCKDWLPWVVFPCASFYLMETFHHNPFANIYDTAQILNIVIFIAAAVLIWAIVGSRTWAFRIESILALIVGLANYYVIDFRGTPIVPWDIYAVKTAALVGGTYSYIPTVKCMLSILAFIVLIVLESIGADQKLAKGTWKIRLISGLCAWAVLFGQYTALQSPTYIARMRIYDKLFTPYAMVKRGGIALAFLLECQSMDIDKPDGYSEKQTAEVYNALEEDALVTDEQLPNIIVVMNEAFSDLAVLGDFTPSEDYMPFVHSLQKGRENTVTGNLNVSIIAGNTANTEFEFLTGISMKFLPEGCVPYQQYIDDETDSMASYLKSLGYKTIAMHPYDAVGWERNEVYPLLGFDTFYSLKDYRGVKKVRSYVSDDSCVDRIIEEFEKSEEPCFLFNVTMQNHSSYTAEYPNFVPDVTVEGSDSFALSNYLSLVKLSDASLERMITYFESVEEDTVIVFFGDHQPADSVVRDIWNINGVDEMALTAEQEHARFQVPFVVWANYDIEEQKDVETSANYLGALMFDWCNIPKSGYSNYLLRLQKEVPVVSSRVIMDAQKRMLPYEEVKEQLLEYNQLQYYRLFD